MINMLMRLILIAITGAVFFVIIWSLFIAILLSI